MFYGDNFHFGFFHNNATTLADGLDAHTDMVASMARLGDAKRILDIGCGILRSSYTHSEHMQEPHHRYQHKSRNKSARQSSS